MRVALIHDALFPVSLYGGTERVVWWLAKGLQKRGVEVTLVARLGSSSPCAKVLPHDFKSPFDPRPFDILHYFATPKSPPDHPFLVTIEGNGRKGERFFQNSVFVSRDHARRHHATSFVYNGIDPDDYKFSETKNGSLVFLAKASWRVKNVKGAIRIARRSNLRLNILGGSRWWLPQWRGIYWKGMVGGSAKSDILASSTALIFPVIWDEPFGLAVIESLVSGTPALVSKRGSLPELVNSEVGAVCNSYDEFDEAIANLGRFSAEKCRDYAASHFHFDRMCGSYLENYEKILAGETLNSHEPFTIEAQGEMLDLAGSRTST